MKRITSALLGIDHVMDCIPFVSMINNGIKAIAKLCLVENESANIQEHTWTKHVQDTPYHVLFWQMVPVFGNFYAYTESTKPPTFEPKPPLEIELPNLMRRPKPARLESPQKPQPSQESPRLEPSQPLGLSSPVADPHKYEEHADLAEEEPPEIFPNEIVQEEIVQNITEQLPLLQEISSMPLMPIEELPLPVHALELFPQSLVTYDHIASIENIGEQGLLTQALDLPQLSFRNSKGMGTRDNLVMGIVLVGILFRMVQMLWRKNINGI